MNRICPKCGGTTLATNGKTPAGKTRWRCFGSTGDRAHCYSTTNPDAPARDQKGARRAERKAFRRALPACTRYIITAAQNATPVHEGFFAALKVAAKHLKAELVVIPLRYKNATSAWTESQENEEYWHVPETLLFDQRKKLNDNLVLVGDVKVQPTAVRPLSGFEGLTHGESCIMGHPKIQLKVVPVAAGKHPKILTTTGVCTVRNYTDSKAGKLGEFHHSLGATMVEIVGKEFHLRQIIAAKDGSFTDLVNTYDKGGVYGASAALGLVLGDTHYRFQTPGVRRATFEGPRSMCALLNPTTLVWHDVDDGYSHNPHHEGNPFIVKAKRDAGFHLVRREVEDTIAFVDSVTEDCNSVIVPSNHDDFLRRWIIKTDWREDVDNADFYFKTALAMWESARMGKGGSEYLSPFAYWVGQLAKNPGVRALGKDESFKLARFECGMHGHEGPNGARGSILNLSRLGSLVISGHGHTPGWEEGHRRVGTSAERQEYEGGPSSHLHTHCVVYASGASCLLTVIGDTWMAG
jgi:hypothetical protein